MVAGRVYLGFTARVLVNVEAMNMAETVGNMARHKRAPVAVPLREGGLVLHYVPVVSGQSIAHGYQEILAAIAVSRGLPVCKLCEQGVFVKHASRAIVQRLQQMGDPTAGQLLREIQGGNICRIESVVVGGCVVEDVGGFLYAEQPPVRRTSRIEFSYMIPSLEYIQAVGAEGLLHARQDPTATREGGQMLYVVEAGSALYTFSGLLKASEIGVLRCPLDGSTTVLDDRVERVRAALDALVELVSGVGFGAKRSRFLPHFTVESLVVTVSKGFRFMPEPGHFRSYIADTVRRGEAAVEALGGGVELRVYYYIRDLNGVRLTEEPGSSERVRVEAKASPEEALKAAKEAVMEALGS